MPQLDKQHFKGLAFPHRLKLALLGFGVLFPLFFITTVKPVPLRGSAEFGVSAV